MTTTPEAPTPRPRAKLYEYYDNEWWYTYVRHNGRWTLIEMFTEHVPYFYMNPA